MAFKLLSHALWALLATFALLAPDLLYWLLHKSYLHPNLATFKQFVALWLLSAFILAVPQKWLRFGFFTLVAILGLSQQLHFAFFHGYIKPYEVPLLFSQQEEIFDTLSHTWNYLLTPLILFLFQITALLWIVNKVKAIQWRFMPLVIVLLLLSGPIVAHKRKRAYVFLPKAHAFGIVNTYTSLSWFLGKELFKKQTTKAYPPYQVVDINITPPRNIIIIMGESVNAKYMSLFGFEKPSTPRLNTLKKDPQFLYGHGFSGGVTTDVAIPTFFLLKREPQNKNPLIDNTTNLVRLAKQRGYTVTFITMQNPMLLSGYIGGFTDKLIAMKGYDEKLLQALKKIDWNKKNFIILHQRNSHSPYEKYTPKRFWKFPFKELDFHDYMFHSYLNSLRYTDYLVTEVFKVIKKHGGVAFFTSDHGEMMGFPDEKGRYGHVVLDFADAKVPFLIYYQQLDPKLLPYIQKVNTIKSHYQFGKIIANSLGYKIINPDENGSFFINGVDILGEQGFLEYR